MVGQATNSLLNRLPILQGWIGERKKKEMLTSIARAEQMVQKGAVCSNHNCQAKLDFNAAVSGTLCNRCQMEKERVERIQENILAEMDRSGIGKRFLNARLDDRTLGLPKKIRNAGLMFAAGKVPGLFFHGIPGCGKTTVAAAVCRELLWSGKSVYFADVPTLMQQATSYRVDKSVVNVLSTRRYVVLDDLGTETKTDWTLDWLYPVINCRYLDKLPTIITSNLNILEIATQIHARLASRLTEMCQVVTFPEVDYRIAQR